MLRPPLVVRSIPWVLVAPLLTVAAIPMVWTSLTENRSGDDTLVVWLLVAGATTAFALDEPDRAITDATPTILARRVARRLALLGAAAVIFGLVVIGLTGFDTASARAHLPATMAVVAVSTAAAAAGHRRGDPRVSPGSAATGPAAVIVVSVLSVRYPWLPSLTDQDTAHRWWWVVVAGGASARWLLRDPYRA